MALKIRDSGFQNKTLLKIQYKTKLLENLLFTSSLLTDALLEFKANDNWPYLLCVLEILTLFVSFWLSIRQCSIFCLI